MSIVSVAGTLILNGDMVCNGSVSVENTGKIIPIANEVTETVFSCPVRDFVSSNGKSPTITSTTSDINIRGQIDGNGRGFPANFGPGANSTLTDNRNVKIPFYGATHAGVGFVKDVIGEVHIYEEDFVINTLQMEERSVILSYFPIEPTNVTMNIIRGTAQEYYKDFYVVGNVLTWRTPRMEPIMGVGDKIRVVYLGDTGRKMPPPRLPYGSYEAPLSIGSGSGEAAGGSGIRLVARSGTVRITGSINMNGQTGFTARSGGASGGSVWIIGYNVTGAGTITANGGGAFYQYAGGGGGGYIAINYEKSNTFNGTLEVDGNDGGTKGIIYIKSIEPFFIEKFTGHVLNTKWWDVVRQPVALNNYVEMDTPVGDARDPLVQSKFSLSGKNIQVDLDFSPSGLEPSYHTSYFRLCVDEENWVGVAKKYGYMFGTYSVDGYPSQTGVPYAYTPTRFRINKADSTFTFQFIDSSSGPQTIFSEVIPEFTSSKFFVRMGTDKDPSDASRRLDYFTLTGTDVLNKYVTLSSVPSDATNVTLNILNGSSQYYGLDYYVSGQQLKWDSTVLPLFYPLTMLVTDYITLTADMVFYKKAKLSTIPVIPQIALNVMRGGPQSYGDDFICINDNIEWGGRRLDGQLAIGDELRVVYLWSSHNELDLDGFLEEGDQLVAQYITNVIHNDLQVNWDNFRVYNGIFHNLETREPTIYVDPNYGSDANDGLRLTPLQNLFVATAWAKRGGTVVLYDGVHNPTEVIGKTLTIMGANGASPSITTANVQDTTGANWENSCLTFQGCQGVVKNVAMTDAKRAVFASNTKGLEIRDCEITDSTTGIRFEQYNYNSRVLGNTIYRTPVAISLHEQVYDPYIYSNVIYDTSNALVATDASGFIVSSNTIDRVVTGLVFDKTSTGIVASNNITNTALGVQVNSDSTVALYHNNFFATSTEYTGNVYDYSGNIWINPQYVNDAMGNYHLTASSPNRGAGTDMYDKYYLDRDNNPREIGVSYDIGAYEMIDGSHGSGPYYVSGPGDDYRNFGTAKKPYRTLDKAMTVADNDVNIDAGHYDSYYLKLQSENINLNTLIVESASQDYVVSYVRLTEDDATRKYIQIPGYATSGSSRGLKRIVMNVLRGPSQEADVDYTVGYGSIFWGGYPLDGLLKPGDVLRLMYPLETKAGSVLTMDSHFSSIDLGKTLFVSPNGSDSSVWGGDGTHSGGNGSQQYPYRSVTRALQDASVAGTNLVVMSGEYEIFNGRKDAVVVPFSDRTGIPDKDGRLYLQSLFETAPTMFTNHVISGTVWDTYSAGSSQSFIQEGYLSMIYDGTNSCGADSIFSYTPQFTVQAEMRQAFDPVFFSIHNRDNTAVIEYNDGDWLSTIITGDEIYRCWGHMDVKLADKDIFFTDYVCLTSQDINNKFVPLTYLLEDTTNVTMNIIGGGSQQIDEDFYAEDGKIKWDGMNLDGELTPGEVLRTVYKARGLSSPVRLQLNLSDDGVLTLRGSDYKRWFTLMKRRLLSDPSTPWSSSFFMNRPSEGIDHSTIFGRGYVSKYFTLAKSFQGTDQAKPYFTKTWRQPILMYNPAVGNP
jgi:hypothetical protein